MTPGVASPSCPSLLKPQQRTFPSPRSAHVWVPPAAMATASAMPMTLTAVSRSVVVPSPSAPKTFEPQQRTVPSTIKAHVWEFPTETATALETPLTRTGVETGELVLVPSPSWPEKFLPQQRTVPSSLTWHECSIPAASLTSGSLSTVSARFRARVAAWLRPGHSGMSVSTSERMTNRRLFMAAPFMRTHPSRTLCPTLSIENGGRVTTEGRVGGAAVRCQRRIRARIRILHPSTTNLSGGANFVLTG